MPFQSRRAKLVLEEETRNRLRALSVSYTAPAAHVERAKILLAFAAGDSISAIARDMKTNRPKVERTIDRALRFGVEQALDDLPRPGRPREIPDEARAWVVDLACRKPTELGYPEELWTTARLAAHIRAHCQEAGYPSLARLGRGTVSKLLAEHKLRPHKVKYYLERRDPDFERKMAEVLHVYRDVAVMRAEQEAGEALPLVAVLSYDEKPGIQAIGRTAPDLPPVPGDYPTWARDYEYKRHGTLSLLCGIDLLTGDLLARVEEKHRSREFVAWLEDVHAHYPKEWKIKIILDNHSAHISKETQQYLATVPNRFEFTFTPKHGSWLNLIEVFFSKLARTLLRGIRVTSRAELKERIMAYIAELKETPVVFRWTYGLDDVA
jgi:transposase